MRWLYELDIENGLGGLSAASLVNLRMLSLRLGII